MSGYRVVHDTSGDRSLGDVTDRPCPTITVGINGLNAAHYQVIIPDPTDDRSSDPPVDALKPPYAVPSMRDVATIAPNGYRLVSTFSGAGGSCLGFRMAGFRTVWASEFVPAAAEVYRANFPDVPLDLRDIRDVTATDILAATGLAVGEIDVLEGSPPCAAFSTAGKRAASWGDVRPYSDTKQRTDDLFFEFVRLLDGLKPKVFVAENVSGLVKGVAKGYFKRILAAMKGAGYRVEARLLDAQWLGVPQARQRIIFIGVRDDLGVAPAFPKPLPYRYSVREALPEIVSQGDNGRFGGGQMRPASGPSPTVGAGPQTGNRRYPASAVEAVRIVHTPGGANGTLFAPRDVTDTPAPSVLAGAGRRGRTDDFAVETDISRYAIGAEWDKIKPGEQSDKYRSLVKPHPDQPCPTVTCGGMSEQFSPTAAISCASVTHPTERRKFMIAELKRICAFPDDFVLTGTYAQQWERLGRAVPPLMMRAVAETLRDDVLGKTDGRL